MKLKRLLTAFLSALFLATAASAQNPPPPPAAPKPLFVDPNYQGSCDPEVVWNSHTQEWWAFYTARRATRKGGTYVGTPLGVIASKDLINWRHLGYASLDGVPGQPDMPVTYWAPGIVRHGDTYHMFVTYKNNATPPWAGTGEIRHYVAPASDLLNGWKLSTPPDFTQPDPIDATLIKVGDRFHAYYRVGKDGGVQWSTSPDLQTWTHQGKCPGEINLPKKKQNYGYQEAPYVFHFKGAYWMLTDPHKGLAVYRSADSITWEHQGVILLEDGKDPSDRTRGRHPSVAVIGERAFILYHVEPNRLYDEKTLPPEERTVHQKISNLQIAELIVKDGKLTCDRNARVIPPASVSPLSLMSSVSSDSRWPVEKAHAWYDAQPWPVGANFVPSTAINQLEMWQADTFDPVTIDRELGWAASIGMNTMRVFLHDLAWSQDPEGFLQRVDQYLAIADKHKIKTMFVLWDSVWHPEPKAGPQPAPTPHVHNSGWIQSPGKALLADVSKHDSLKPYVVAVMTRFKNDPRVHSWDLFNEPDNANVGNFGGDSKVPDLKPAEKSRKVYSLLDKTFDWAREVNPSQPLTVGVWGAPVWVRGKSDLIDQLALARSDIISFHTYEPAELTREMILGLKKHGRPILCTEYMARGNGSTFEAILPLFKEHRVAAYNWGFVDGKSQTIYPWDSWKKKYTGEPDLWFHDIFRRDGTPYREAEVKLIRELTAAAAKSAP